MTCPRISCPRAIGRARTCALTAAISLCLVARASCDMVKIKMAEGARVAKPKGGKAKVAKEPELPFVEVRGQRFYPHFFARA